MMNNSYFKLVKKIWEEDHDSQAFFFEQIKQVRNSDFNPHDLYSIFIPNENYLENFCDEEMMANDFGLFKDGKSLWVNQMILPLCDILGIPRGIVSFDPFTYLDVHNGETGDYYAYSKNEVCQKNNFMYAHPKSISVGLDSYIFVVDGIFDAISLYTNGFNAAALMGSTISDIVIAQLQLFPKVILIMDNDEAGFHVKKRLASKLHNFEVYKVNKYKDIDEALKFGNKILEISNLRKLI